MKPSNPGILCIIGTGVQARSHAEALRLICNFEEVSKSTLPEHAHNMDLVKHAESRTRTTDLAIKRPKL